MSSASIPAPRGTPVSGSRSNYFWPLLIFFLGAGALAFYQVESLDLQLSEVTTAADRLDPQVKLAQYEKAKFYAMARDLLRLAPDHPGAAKLVDELKLRKLAAAQPLEMSLTDHPSGFTNTAPTLPAAPSGPKTNAPASPLIQPAQ